MLGHLLDSGLIVYVIVYFVNNLLFLRFRPGNALAGMTGGAVPIPMRAERKLSLRSQANYLPLVNNLLGDDIINY